jgi:hypothetical protein
LAFMRHPKIGLPGNEMPLPRQRLQTFWNIAARRAAA